jgi:transglutaminase-like putative cysteine protease
LTIIFSYVIISLHLNGGRGVTGKLKWLSRKWLAIVAGLMAVLMVLIILPGCQQTAAAKYSSSTEVIPRTRQGVVTFDITLDLSEGADEARVWLPYPTSNKYQTIEDVKIEGNFDSSGVYREEEHGTINLYAEWNEPREDARLTYSFEITRNEIFMKDFPEKEAPVPLDIMEKYLLLTNLGSTIGDVKETAEEITSGQNTILGKATAIYDYIVETGERDPDIKGCGVGDVGALLQNLSGKCADISPVFVALARSVGVPAREVLGTRIGTAGDISGAFHCRAEFYLPGYGWVPVDPSDVLKFHLKNECDKDSPELLEAQQYFFGAQTETYVDFYYGKEVTLNPAQDGGSLIYFMYPYAEVDGKPLPFETPPHPVSQEGLEYVVTYEEIVSSTPWPW